MFIGFLNNYTHLNGKKDVDVIFTFIKPRLEAETQHRRITQKHEKL